MNVKVSKRVLENAIKTLLEQDAPPEASTGATAPRAADSPPDAPSEPPPAEKTLTQRFEEKVKELEAAPDTEPGNALAIGNVKFVKRAGKWEISSAGDKGSIDKDTLLSLVSDAAQEDILKKIAADDKVQGRLGVTVRGDQFIEPTEKGANFVKDDKGYYRDITPVPVQILAQYLFQEEEGEDAGAVRASLARSAGESLLVYRTDKLMYVLDPGKGDLYILSIADNVDNPLQATSNLLDQLDKEGRIKSTGSTLKGLRRKTSAEQLLTSLDNLRKFLIPTGEGTPFDVRIRDFQFIGDLQKALADRRTLFSKFVDLFQADQLEMSFVYSPWGPAFKRARVLGSRGLAGGAGALSGTDMDALKATGLFTEESLPKSTGGSYIPAVGDPPGLIDAPAASVAVSEVTVKPGGPSTGAIVAGVGTLGNALTSETTDVYTDTYADAWFLFSNGGLSAKEKPKPAAAPAEAPDAAKVDDDKALNDLIGKMGQPLGDPKGAVFFDFDKKDEYTEDPPGYIDSVADEAIMLMKALTPEQQRKVIGSIRVTMIVTADPTGKEKYNDDLAKARAEVIKNKVEPKIKAANIPNLGYNAYSLGEKPWLDKQEEYLKLADNDARKPLRFAKAYLDASGGQYAITDQKALALATAFGESKMGTPATATLAESLSLEETIRRQVRDMLKTIK